MEKVLIISYFFPPCNLTAAQRVGAFAKHLNKFGYYPIVITRHWSVSIAGTQDIVQSNGTAIQHEKLEGYEVYYLPYRACLRDRILQKLGSTPLRFLSKALTAVMLIGQNFHNYFIPYENIYDFALEVIQKQNIKKAIVSAQPFESFRFGYLLHKKTGIKWVADYRDDWNTSEFSQSKKNVFYGFFNKRSERKWVGTAEFITSVSPYYVDKIAKFTKRRGFVVYNGYEPNELYSKNSPNNLYDKFTIVYNGTMYNEQSIEIFLSGFKSIIDTYTQNIQIIFPGLAFIPTQALRVKKCLTGYEEYYKISNRIPREDVLLMQKRAHLMLMVAYGNLKGVPSSKLYEYLGLKKPVMLCPSDNDIIAETLEDYYLGVVCNTPEDVAKYIISLIQKYRDNQDIFNIDNINTSTYTRREQTKNMAAVLNMIKP